MSSNGLSGSATILEIGGPPFLLPLVQRDKLYDLKAICQRAYSNGGPENFLAIGAGAGPHPLVNTNCEGIYNLSGSGASVTNGSRLARIEQSAEERCVLERIPDTETRLALLGNIFLSEGKAGPALRVHCATRIGEDNFVTAVRLTLESHFKPKTLGLGGVFLLKRGTSKQHVMRDFSATPLHTEEDLNKWLKFFEMPAELINVGTLVTNDNPGLDLRLQHFHNFSMSADRGGHYHYDTTPEIAEYEGYFNVASKLIRIDKPVVTHQVGRD